MDINFLLEVFDRYELEARFYPALLVCVSPFMLLFAFALHDIELPEGLITSGATITIITAIMYLMANVAREKGKQIEQNLYKEWGGKPTVQLLRLNDKRIDSTTKSRYHRFLSEKLNIPFPHRKNKRHAVSDDEIYESATQWLLEQTRDKKRFNLVFVENIRYGFYRNCLGLKPFAIMAMIASILYVLIRHYIIHYQYSFYAIQNSELLILLVSFIMMGFWGLFITKSLVQKSAFTYARTLLKTCDVLSQVTP